MSCIGSGLLHSEMPRPISLKPAVRAPSICVDNVMGSVFGDAVATCEAFVASGTGSPREIATALVNLGHTYRSKRGQFSNPVLALEAWDKAITADPTFAEPHVQKGDVAARGKNPVQALPHYEHALKLEPTHWRAMMGIARVRAKLGQIDEALALGRKALDVAPDVGVAHQIYAGFLKQAGRHEEEIAELRKATIGYDDKQRQLPGVIQESSPWNALAQAERRLGRYANAIDDISMMIEGLPDNQIWPGYLEQRASIYEEADRASEAAADYEKAADLYGPNFERADELRTRAAILRAASGNSDAAHKIFSDLIRSGKLQTILRIQVFLRNNGFDDVAIDGKSSPVLESALERCLADRNCKEVIGQAI